MFTVKELLDKYNGQYKEVEFYKATDNYKSREFHGDFIEPIDDEDVPDDCEVIGFEFMDEEQYDHTVLANCSIRANFEEWYDNRTALILCVLVK